MRKTNDIKKGEKVLLNYGMHNGQLTGVRNFAEYNMLRLSFSPWEGIMADNMKGNRRMVDVFGIEREIGSVYSHDIIAVWNNKWNDWEEVEHTPAQLRLKEEVKIMFS